MISSNALRVMARLGYASRGVVYLIVGGVALNTAIGSGDKTTGSSGALTELMDKPFGVILAGIVGLGLACYAAWRFLQAFADADNQGRDFRGIFVRICYGLSGSIHVALAWIALTGAGSGSASEDGMSAAAKGATWLIEKPMGQWLLGIVGISIILYGLTHHKKGWRENFEDRLALDESRMKWASPICKLGLAARGVVLYVIGGFLIAAAYQEQPRQARGVGGALESMEEQILGSWMLGVTAAGLIAFGVYCFIAAAYRRIEPK